MRKLVLVAMAVGLTAAAPASEALAWGCVAVDSQGAYGYSYNWASEEDAELTALQQCEKHSNTDDCQTDSCDPNG